MAPQQGSGRDESDKPDSGKTPRLTDRVYLAEMLLDASIDQVIAIDTDRKIISWNQTCEAYTKLTTADVLGRALAEVLTIYETNEALNEALGNAFEGFKVFVKSTQGSFGGNYFEHHFIPLKARDGETEGVLIVLHEVAHRVKIEQELKSLNKSLARKNRELQQRNQELLTFAHITGHDLKEPLRKIYTFIDMILTRETGGLSDEGHKLFKRVQASAQRMGMLTDDILHYAELSSLEHKRELVNLNGTLKFALSLLKGSIDGSNAVVEHDILPAIQGYRNLLSQFFQHMLSNALKFQESGHIPHVFVQVKEVSGKEIEHPDAIADQAYYRISFRDNGIGIKRQYFDRIFMMFQRLNSANLYPGTGIGLSLCRKIADIHNGFITVESEVRLGSSFHCFFPAGTKD